MDDLETAFLKWAGRQKLWQQDILRRLATGETLSTTDYRAYADEAYRLELEKLTQWYEVPAEGTTLEWEAVAERHLALRVVGGDPVRLLKVTHLAGANDLAPGAELEFNSHGLTIIAGGNGSGKSGYTRILKQVASSRAPEQVLPNVFGTESQPKAVVRYQLGSDTPTLDFSWTSGATEMDSDGSLRRVRVFDTQSATTQINGSNEVAYVPSTLQILGKYTQALQEVAGVLEDDAQLQRLDSKDWPELAQRDTQSIFDNLGADKGLTALRAVQPLTETEAKELEAIPSKLHELTASDPAALAIQARERSMRLKDIAQSLRTVSAKLELTTVKNSIKLARDVRSAKEDVDNAVSIFDRSDLFPGTGNERWREMWLAAKAFADEQNQQHRFPDGFSECPLCGQGLDTTATERFEMFSRFMIGEAQTKFASATTLRKADKRAIAELPLETLSSQSLIDFLSTYDKQMSEELTSRAQDATQICDALMLDNMPEGIASKSLSTDLNKIAEQVNQAAKDEDGKAAELAAADTSALAASQLKERHNLLADRAAIVAARDAIGAEHDRRLRLTALEAAKASCSTHSASAKNSALSREYIEKVCERFEMEALNLGIRRLPVELVFDRSKRGVSYIKVQLKDAPTASVSEVLSEGEQRTVAIAAFFADLAESGDTSTLVFDDPVSSLDQAYRVQVAKRLIAEAETRQVLIFTHDFTFVQYLYEEKRLADTTKLAEGDTPTPDLNYLHIARSSKGCGVPTSAETWRHVPIKERIGRLKDRQQAAAALYRKNETEAYDKVARDIIGALRETWEVFVEHVLLNSVVTRHERSVQTSRLSKVADLDKTDINRVELGMTVESRFMTGHAAPVSDGSTSQDPEWVLCEISKLEDFTKEVNKRRN